MTLKEQLNFGVFIPKTPNAIVSKSFSIKLVDNTAPCIPLADIGEKLLWPISNAQFKTSQKMQGLMLFAAEFDAILKSNDGLLRNSYWSITSRSYPYSSPINDGSHAPYPPAQLEVYVPEENMASGSKLHSFSGIYLDSKVEINHNGKVVYSGKDLIGIYDALMPIFIQLVNDKCVAIRFDNPIPVEFVETLLLK